MHRLLAAARSPRTQVAAGDPCRRHQWQGFDDRLSARDSRSRRPARPRLYLAFSGADQRVLSPRPQPVAACWSTMTNCAPRSNIANGPTRAQPITIFEIETAAAFCLFAQHPADVVLLEVGLGGTARLHQCDRRAARDRHRAGQHGSHRVSRRHADRDRRREGRDHQAQRAGGLRRAGAGSDGGDRGAGQPHARADACGRPAMACQRRARPAGLSGRARPDGSGGAKTVRAASVRQCRAGDRDPARASMRSRSACPLSRPASSTPNGRRGCSVWCRARWSIRGRRAARSGSTADTMPKAAASRPRRSAISRSGCRGHWS